MKQLIKHIIPSLRILQIAGNAEQFESWLQKYHSRGLDSQLLAGYKFFIECAFSELLYGVSIEDGFEIKDDFLMKCAIGQGIYPLEKLPNICERIIFLKHINNHFKPILRAKSAKEVQDKVKLFDKHIGQFFEKVFVEQFQLIEDAKITYDQAIRLLLIENLYIYFTQIKNNGPVAYMGALQKNFWIPEKKLIYCFEGYKFVLQYLWCRVLEKDNFEKAKLNTLHLADSWREYQYIELPPDASDFERIFGQGREFEIEKQTSLDSFFHRIKDGIIVPIQEKIQMDILAVHELFERKQADYSKEVFENLLSKKELKDPYDELIDDDKIALALYWYPLEVFEPGQMHNGITAFIIALAGTVSLAGSEKEREFEKVIICKFAHPLEEGKNDYSYGVLLDAKAAAGHYSSGWLLYYDCCNDYSGFSGSEHRRAESLIKKYVDNELVELRELKVDKSIFCRYVARHIHSSEELTREKTQEVEEQLETQSREQRLRVDDVVGKAKAIILEQLTYYAFSKIRKSPDTIWVDWSTDKSDGEIDIVVKTKDSVKIIECKVNPNTCNLSEEHKKLISKLKKQPEKDKNVEFWFWIEPSPQNMRWLEDNGIRYEYINNTIKLPDTLNGVYLKNIKYVMNYTL